MDSDVHEGQKRRPLEEGGDSGRPGGSPGAEQADQPLWILGCPGEWPYHVHLLSVAIHLLSFYEGSNDRSGPIPSVKI